MVKLSSPCMTSIVIPSNSGNTIEEHVERKAEDGVGCCGMLFSGHDMTYKLGEAVVACTNSIHTKVNQHSGRQQ